MSAKIDFIYLSEPDMIKAGVKDMGKCVEVMEDMMVTLNKGDYVMGGENHNSHGCMVTFPDNPEFEGMPKNGEDRRCDGLHDGLEVGGSPNIDPHKQERQKISTDNHRGCL